MHLIKRSYDRLLRPHLPRKLGYFGGFVVRFPKLFDFTDVNHEMQNFERGVHKTQTRAGDTVVVVGVGSGVSTIAGAKAAGGDGRVVGFEASSELAEANRESMELNDVDDIVEIIARPVTEITLNTWGEEVAGEGVSPTDLPEADVLELDCEGAELEILEQITFRPRILSIEAHPPFGVDVEDVEKWLSENDYKIIKKRLDAPADESVAWLVAGNSHLI